MAPKVAMCGTITIQFFFFLENGPKQSQTGPNKTRWGQTGPNEAKQDQTVQNRANLDQRGPTGAERSHLELTGPCIGFHMSVHINLLGTRSTLQS